MLNGKIFSIVSVILWTVVSLARPGLTAPVRPAGADWPAIILEPVISGLQSPVQLAHSKDTTGRLFIVEQPGRIRILKDGALLPAPFLDITDRVLYQGEQGLLGLAFPKNFSVRRVFYVYYTDRDGNNRVARFRLTANPNVADPGSETLILFMEHPSATNHNGGQLAFGPDDYLYISTGDAANGANAQSASSLLGKILRIDPEPHPQAAPYPPPAASVHLYHPIMIGGSTLALYNIPAGNPYRNDNGKRGEIWALGLRNPWRFSFDRSTGDLYVADVGQNRIEEVNFQAAGDEGGVNYGWNILEGNLCFSPSSGCVPPPGYVPPVATYEHGPDRSIGCSVTGGFVYRGSSYPALQGIYFYADYCSGRIWGLKRDGTAWDTTELLQVDRRWIGFGEDSNGEIYLLAIDGTVHQLASP